MHNKGMNMDALSKKIVQLSKDQLDKLGDELYEKVKKKDMDTQEDEAKGLIVDALKAKKDELGLNDESIESVANKVLQGCKEKQRKEKDEIVKEVKESIKDLDIVNQMDKVKGIVNEKVDEGMKDMEEMGREKVKEEILKEALKQLGIEIECHNGKCTVKGGSDGMDKLEEEMDEK